MSLSLPVSFNWAEALSEGIKVEISQSYNTCSLDAVLSCLADHFYISKKVEQPIILSSMSLAAGFKDNNNLDKRMEVTLDKRRLQVFDRSSFSVHTLILYLEKYGAPTTSCLERLPEFSRSDSEDIKKAKRQQLEEIFSTIPANTCYYAGERATFFLKRTSSYGFSNSTIII